VKKHIDMKNEEMSDFSIQSPVKRSESSMKNSHLPKTVTKKLKFGSSKKGFDDKYSSASELESPENILHSVSYFQACLVKSHITKITNNDYCL
jgi:hypothetical protein